MPGQRQLIGNSFSVILGRLTQGVTSFIITAAIARSLGSQALGQYLIGFTYYFIFMSIIAQGFRTLFIRELSRNPSDAPICLVSGTLLQLVASLIGYILLCITIFLFPYSDETSTVCYIIGLAIIPFSLSNIPEAIMQAQEKMHLIAISTVPIYILRVGSIIWAMELGFQINQIALIFVLSETLILLIEWVLVLKLVQPNWRVNWRFIRQTTGSVRTFLALFAIDVLNSRRQLLILSVFGSEALVGLFGGILQFMMPFDIVNQGVLNAVFPRLSKAASSGGSGLRRPVEQLLEVSLCLAVPYVIGLFFIGKELLALVYQNREFADTSIPLSLVAISLIVIALCSPLSQALVAGGLERINLREVIVNALIGGIISVVLISRYQLIGAALTPIITAAISLSQFAYSVHVRLFQVNLWAVIRRPLFVGGFMLLVFMGLQQLEQDVLLKAAMATGLYSLLIIGMGIHLLGGPNIVLAKLLTKYQKS
ncbi:MAG: oligosaccharide flippase family protein [Elainella sp. C42_A2020_010]|nr:oligosaccharide flippase family protein [Elainella sp. C42_A2020_010]